MASTSFGQYLRGVNLAGAEFGENNLPGTLGHDYTFNSETSYRYFGAKNLSLMRVMFRWERLQPVLHGPLNADYLAGIRSNLAWGQAHGCKAILDIHNYGRYKISENGVLTTYTLDNKYGGVVKVSGSDLSDLWARLSAEFRDDPGVYAYDLMNEPHDMGSASWKAISQAALLAIRANGDGKLVMVPGDNWSSAEQWPRVHGPAGWITDPANNFAYEAHQYFDRDNSGSYALTYDQELAQNANLATTGPTRLANFVNWLKSNNVRGYLGEYGIPNTDARWMTVLDNFLVALDAAGLDGTYWAAGEWWGDYSLSMQPLNNFATDRPQLRVLAAHLTPGSFTTVSAASSSGFVFAPDSLVSGYGQGLGASPVVELVDATGATIAARLLFVSPSQVNYLVPAGLSPGRLDVVVRNDGSIVSRGSLEVEKISPALFSAAQILRVKADGTRSEEPVVQSSPIDFGDSTDRLYLVLFGTGFRNASSTSLQIGTTTVPLLYAGPQPEFAGLDQANVELPRSLIGAGEVSVVLRAENKLANSITLTFR